MHSMLSTRQLRNMHAVDWQEQKVANKRQIVKREKIISKENEFVVNNRNKRNTHLKLWKCCRICTGPNGHDWFGMRTSIGGFIFVRPHVYTLGLTKLYSYSSCTQSSISSVFNPIHLNIILYNLHLYYAMDSCESNVCGSFSYQVASLIKHTRASMNVQNFSTGFRMKLVALGLLIGKHARVSLASNSWIV